MAKFIDEAIIDITSGNGGPGAVSFRREKFIPRGGPNGGDGGRGGDVWIIASANLNSLMDLRYKRKYAAENGHQGMSTNKSGSDGADLFLPLPIGSILTDPETKEVLGEILDENTRILLAKGGRGGKGNTHFKSSTHQAPRYAQPGESGETKKLKVELKLLADVGIVGYPNAGKSTLISKISAAKPKIANYPFTTLVPNLGVVRVGNDELAPTFIVADVPGLIEGASLGRGLGHRFLKHLERTRVLLHLIDGAKLLKEFGNEDMAEIVSGAIHYKEIIDAELYTFHPDLAGKPTLFIFNKCDLFDDAQIKKMKALFKKKGFKDMLFISGVSHVGLEELVFSTFTLLKSCNDVVIEDVVRTQPPLPYVIT